MNDLTSLLEGLPSQFERSVSGRTLILDADFPAYEASATVKKLPTALTRFQTLVETEVFLTSSMDVQVHLTPRGCTKCRRYDYPTAKPYQGNREGKAKPPLLEPLRMAIPNHPWPEHWSTFAWRDREADDGMMMHSFALGANGLVCSGDKDLCLTPHPYWIIDEGRVDIIKDRFGWIKRKEWDKDWKIVGHGTKFFWCQMLMGDPADNVQGILRWYGKKCGKQGAWEIMHEIDNEDEAANLVLQAYADAGQDFLAEAQCLWLRRSLDDCAFKYLSELDLKPQLREWMGMLHDYHGQYLAAIDEQKEFERGEDQSSEGSGTEASGNPSGIRLPWED